MFKCLVFTLLSFYAVSCFPQSRVDMSYQNFLGSDKSENSTRAVTGFQRKYYDASPYNIPMEESDQVKRKRANESGLCNEFRGNPLALENCINRVSEYSPQLLESIKRKNDDLNDHFSKMRDGSFLKPNRLNFENNERAVTEADVRRIVAEMLATYDRQRTADTPRLGFQPDPTRAKVESGPERPLPTDQGGGGERPPPYDVDPKGGPGSGKPLGSQ